MRKRKKEDIEELTPKKSKSRYAVLFFTILITITTIVSIFDLYLLLSIESFKKYIYIAIGVLVLILLTLISKTKKRGYNK